MVYWKLVDKNEEKIKELIMDGKKRGVCDGEGESIMVNGRPIARRRKMPKSRFRKIY